MKLFLFLCIFFNGFSFSQTYDSFDNHFSKSEKKIANTASKFTYLTKTEKEVFFYLNLARINPKLFAKTFLINNKEKIDCEKDYNSLYKTLTKMDPLGPLYFNHDFYLFAKCHAIQSGKRDYVGHERKSGSGCKPITSSKSWGECCYYGEEDALAIVLDLLVDCNYRGLGHRKIMLSEQFKSMGVYIAPHKSYNFNAVLDFTSE